MPRPGLSMSALPPERNLRNYNYALVLFLSLLMRGCDGGGWLCSWAPALGMVSPGHTGYLAQSIQKHTRFPVGMRVCFLSEVMQFPAQAVPGHLRREI